MKQLTRVITVFLASLVFLGSIPVFAQAEMDPATRQGRRGRIMQQVEEQKLRQAPQEKPALGIQIKSVRGVQVLSIQPGSPAEQAGVQPGDIITEINRTPVNTAEEVRDLVAAHDASQPILIAVSRKDASLFLTARLQGAGLPGAGSGRPHTGRPAPGGMAADEVDPAQTSQDPTYGYTKENPVKLGAEGIRQAASASHVYLRQLRDKNRKPFQYNRIGNVGEGADGHITDLYRLVDSEGNEYKIYVDMYHPENDPLACKAPKGMFIAQ